MCKLLPEKMSQRKNKKIAYIQLIAIPVKLLKCKLLSLIIITAVQQTSITQSCDINLTGRVTAKTHMYCHSLTEKSVEIDVVLPAVWATTTGLKCAASSSCRLRHITLNLQVVSGRRLCTVTEATSTPTLCTLIVRQYALRPPCLLYLKVGKFHETFSDEKFIVSFTESLSGNLNHDFLTLAYRLDDVHRDVSLQSCEVCFSSPVRLTQSLAVVQDRAVGPKR